jgi:hypothetical protein
MSTSLADLQAQRDQLWAAMMSGVKIVAYGDKTVTYQSLSEMQSALATLDAAISAASDPSSSGGGSRTTLAGFRRD